MSNSRLVCRIMLPISACCASGCLASATNGVVIAALAPAGAVPLTASCDTTTCAVRWQRSQVWIAKHSQYKVQTANDVMIQTYNPTNSEARYGFSVLKEPTDSGRYKISITMTCGNLFGCDPKVGDVERAFYYYVLNGKDLLDGISNLGGGIHYP